MPLLVLSGFPSSGKTRRAMEIKDFFEKDKNKKVVIVSENNYIKNKNEVCNDSRLEKEVRGSLKAEMLRELHKDNLIIMDAGNYIKGYRYELYCGSKQHGTTQVTVHVLTPPDQAWKWNAERPQEEQYSKQVFDALVMRFETPNSNNRWDSPMFTLLPESSPAFEDIFGALYLRKPPPPNQSTQTQPLAPTNFLYELDRATQDVVSCIMSSQKTQVDGDSIKVPNTQELVNLGRKASLGDLTRARRQYITYTKMHPVDDTSRITTLFVQYLNSTLG